MIKQTGEDRGVVADNAVGDKAATFAPDLLLIFGLEAQLSEIGIGNGAAELVVAFATIESLLDVAPQWRGVDVSQQIQTLDDLDGNVGDGVTPQFSSFGEGRSEKLEGID